MALNRISPANRVWFNAIRESLSRDQLTKKWQELVPAGSDRVCGHCYLASEAVFHAFAKGDGYVPYVTKLDGGGTHWWLALLGTSDVIDPTHEQTKKPFPYAEVGVRKPFRPGVGPNRESKRCLRWGRSHGAA